MVYTWFNNNKYTRLKNALKSIDGIGSKRAQVVAAELRINPNHRFFRLKPIQISKISKYLTTVIGSFLQKDKVLQENSIKRNIKIL